MVEEALLHNREVLAAQKKYEAARQKPSRENSLPDPTVSLGYTAVGAIGVKMSLPGHELLETRFLPSTTCGGVRRLILTPISVGAADLGVRPTADLRYTLGI